MNEQEFTRRETFLKKIAGYSVDKLPEPLTREEVYLKKIAENGYRKVKELLSYGGQVDKILGMI